MNVLEALTNFKQSLHHPAHSATAASGAPAASSPAGALTTSVRPADSSGSSSDSGGDGSTTITANDFLQLLVAEMQNQDPTADQDPNEYIDQLVQVNSLQQLIAINQDLGGGSSGSSGSGSTTGSVARAHGSQLGSAAGSAAAAVATALAPHPAQPEKAPVYSQALPQSGPDPAQNAALAGNVNAMSTGGASRLRP